MGYLSLIMQGFGWLLFFLKKMTDNLTVCVGRCNFPPDTFKLLVICKETHKGPIFIQLGRKFFIIGALILYSYE